MRRAGSWSLAPACCVWFSLAAHVRLSALSFTHELSPNPRPLQLGTGARIVRFDASF